jgi:hypothetical protein
MGIGENSTDSLMSLSAYADPIVPPSSTDVFLTNLGLDLGNSQAVDPDSVGVSFPAPADYASGAYRYGVAGKPVVHSFLLTPYVDLTEEPYYSNYDTAVQEKATAGAQGQVYGYLLAP